MSRIDFSQPPFDVLSPIEREGLKTHTKVRYLAKNERLKAEDMMHFYVVLKGNVQQLLADNVVGHFHATQYSNDWFDARKKPEDKHCTTLNATDNSSENKLYQYIATEDALLLQIEASAIDRLSAANHHIRNLLSGDLTERMQALTMRQRSGSSPPLKSAEVANSANPSTKAETQQLMLQPVTEAHLLDVHMVDGDATLLEAAKNMTAAGLKHVLVSRSTSSEDDFEMSKDNLGILTDADICRAVSKETNMATALCRDYAKFKLRTINIRQDVSEALLIMVRYRVHRLPVIDDNGEVVGILGQSDLLSFLSHHSHLITVQIEQVKNFDMLYKVVEQIGQYIRSQHNNGIKIGVISRMVQTLNAHVFTKLWQLIIPDEVFKNSCLIVMGSEGRGEQIMRTDQDNALILRDGFDYPNLAELANEFNQSLSELGYPLCDGDIMLNNPIWRKPISEFKTQVSSWFANKQPEHSIWLASVLDAHYVCGDESLMDELREHLVTAHKNSDPMFIRSFARAALQFGDVNQWWQKFAPLLGKEQDHDVDLKKAGIFPLVHGIRAMALENDILEVTSTKERLKGLVNAGVMSQKRATTLNESLEFFMARRLDVALINDDKFARRVDPTTLSALERDLLKECLNVVKSFKNQLRSHYQLEIG